MTSIPRPLVPPVESELARTVHRPLGLVRLLFILGMVTLIACVVLVQGMSLLGAALPASQIAYVAWDRMEGESTLELLDVRQRQAVALYQWIGQLDTPTWTPDGQTLIFARDREDRLGRDLAALDLPSLDFRWLTHGPYDNTAPDVSPDGRSVLFQRDTRSPSQWDVHVLDLDSGETRPIFEGGGIDGQPDWSADGRSLTYDMSWNGYTEMYTTLYVLPFGDDQPGEDPLRVVGSNSFTGDWSPDGTALAFASSRDGSYDIYRADVAGRTVERLTHHPYSDFAPAWSPDGGLIAFISRRDSDGEAHLFVMHADGTEVRRLSPSVLTGTRSYFYPAWRPSP